ncbi:MAG: type II secretion system F family protein [Pseudomonadales bacterium]
MPVFKYKAMDPTGKIVNNEMEAEHEIDLETRLRSQKLDLISSKKRKKTAIAGKGSIPNRQEIINFCFYLEQLQGAGVPLVDALKDLRDSLEKGALHRVDSGLIQHIESGKKFSEALGEYPAVFPTSFVSLVEAGEESGEMHKVLSDLSESLKWQDELIAQTKKALIQPAFMIVVVIGLLFYMMTQLVPQLTSFIMSMGQELPAHTIALIAVSDFFVAYWYLILGVPIACVFALTASVTNSPKVRFHFDRIKLKIPIIGEIFSKIILARFSNYFALMFSAGIPVLRCMEVCKRITDNKHMELALETARSEITAGKNIHTALDETNIFPPLVVRMIRVGETSGRLDQSLVNVSYFYKREVDEAIGKMQAMMQPMMTIVIGAIIAWIMLSVLGPMYDLIGTVG